MQVSGLINHCWLLDKSTKQDQAFSDWKKRLVTSISASHLSSSLLLDSKEQVVVTMFNIFETLAQVSEGSNGVPGKGHPLDGHI